MGVVSLPISERSQRHLTVVKLDHSTQEPPPKIESRLTSFEFALLSDCGHGARRAERIEVHLFV